MDGAQVYRAEWLSRSDTVDGLSYYVMTGTPLVLGGESLVKVGDVLWPADELWRATPEQAEADVAEQCMRLAARLVDQANTLRKGGAA